MKCYAAYAKDEQIRKQGSSGALFPLLSTACIRNGGVVYASVYGEQLNVRFARVEDEEGLQKTFTSKYVQSTLGDTFRSLEADLKAERSVLFCGTQCQAAGLRRYLNKRRVNSDRLLLAEIICHGVPSPDVFQKFMKAAYPDCTSINMRNKDLGWDWGTYAWKLGFTDGTEKVYPLEEVAYMKGFQSKIFLRPSCYHCAAKPGKAADITLGDFWGLCYVNDQIPTRYGVSAVILRTKAGEEAFSAVSEVLECFEVEYEDILQGNPRLETSVPKPVYRDRFFKKLRSRPDGDIVALINDASTPSFTDKVINKLYSKLPQGSTPVRHLTGKGERVRYASKEQCSGCSACYSICPTDAISMKKDSEGFLYAVIDETKCVNCGACNAVCPFASTGA